MTTSNYDKWKAEVDQLENDIEMMEISLSKMRVYLTTAKKELKKYPKPKAKVDGSG